jgi:hypothetical protein
MPPAISKCEALLMIVAAVLFLYLLTTPYAISALAIVGITIAINLHRDD